tara:strand:- start:629 stop:1141 length:513 start_codon:yes stop_codon:yes gene_type:complete
MKLTILRGLPGSGKSKVACDILASYAGVHHNPIAVSADSYPGLYSEIGGRVRINPSMLDKAHGSCFANAIWGLERGVHVVVDNTNLSTEEVIPYVSLAQAFRAKCEVVTLICPPSLAYERQTHGVPEGAFDRMVKRFESYKPLPHWAHLDWLSHHELCWIAGEYRLVEKD